MGNSLPQSKAAPPKPRFELVAVIGRGGYGKVWQVTQKPSNRTFAMKSMVKSQVIAKKSVHSVLNERRLLTQLKHPFIVNMQQAFQDAQHLYLVMDLMHGGDLRFNFARTRHFSECQVRFFVACLVTALEYLHLNGIVHRDVKPENLVLDARGYLRLTDFGIAQHLRDGSTHNYSGTPGYMAPEVMARQPYNIQVDYFAVGVLVYEFMKGRRPYVGRSRKEIKDHMTTQQVMLKRSEVPQGWSLEAADFVNKLLVRKPEDRLGANGPLEVKNHSWLRDFNWKRLFEKTLEPPYCPQAANNFDANMYQNWPEEPNPEHLPAGFNDLFADYMFNSESESPLVTASTAALPQ